jgi:peroxiredoxin
MVRKLVTTIGAALAAACAHSQPLGVGAAAPPFKLAGSDGKMHDSADYRGKYVVVAWFPKAFTGG